MSRILTSRMIGNKAAIENNVVPALFSSALVLRFGSRFRIL
jgi:hypothetical protein